MRVLNLIITKILSSSDILCFVMNVLRIDEMIQKDKRYMRKALSSLHMYS